MLKCIYATEELKSCICNVFHCGGKKGEESFAAGVSMPQAIIAHFTRKCSRFDFVLFALVFSG